MSTYKLTVKEKAFNALGLFMLFIVLVAAVISYGILPLFTRWPTEIFSPALNVISVGTSLLLLWFGSREYLSDIVKQVDNRLSDYLLYKVLKSLVVATWKIFAILVSLALLIWTDRNLFDDEPSTSLDHPEHQPSGWDLHPKHYYDNDPPPPFS